MREIYLLNDTKYDGVKNLSVFEIKYLTPQFTPKNYDAIVFTSKNAVFGIDRIYKEWKKLSAYSIGEGTSKAIKEFGGDVVHEAKISYGDAFADEISQKLFGKSALFARAKVVSSDVGGILKSRGVHVDEVVVYENICKPCADFTPSSGAIFIFTSPSSVKCFLKCVKWRDDFTAVAIGLKTAAAFGADIKPLLAPKTSIHECVEFAKRLSKVSL